MQIDRVDHLVLTVADVERTVEFYSRVLEMEPATFGDGRRALLFGRQKINLHQAGNEFEPKAQHPTPGSADLCFVADAEPEEVLDHLSAHGVDVVEGPVGKEGALGGMNSVYFRDPDGNLIEVSRYPEQEKNL